jgi:UDP-N-acetylglucosamine 2-epimerase (non-hydrolysing)
MKKKIMLVAGARPNFVKIAPLLHELNKYKKYFSTVLVHTGQHYDFKMSEIFFRELNIPKPNIHLNVGSGSHASQTATIMTAFEKVVLKEKPDVVVVVGDVNSTVACSLVASKLTIKVAHVEAGLRSFDRTMPEEINRIVTDSLSDYLFVSEQSGCKNLKKEGIPQNKVFFVGNVMIDTLLSIMDKINKATIRENLFPKPLPSPSQPSPYAVITLHRPGNVDSIQALSEIYTILKKVSGLIKIIYPIHPRTKKMIQVHSYLQKFERLKNLTMIEPLGYIDFIKLVSAAAFVLTDSGGIQEETTVLGIPCLTMRTNTERPITIKRGTNHLVGRDVNNILKQIKLILTGKAKKGAVPELWDGKSAERIINVLLKHN